MNCPPSQYFNPTPSKFKYSSLQGKCPFCHHPDGALYSIAERTINSCCYNCFHNEILTYDWEPRNKSALRLIWQIYRGLNQLFLTHEVPGQLLQALNCSARINDPNRAVYNKVVGLCHIGKLVSELKSIRAIQSDVPKNLLNGAALLLPIQRSPGFIVGFKFLTPGKIWNLYSRPHSTGLIFLHLSGHSKTVEYESLEKALPNLVTDYFHDPLRNFICHA